MATMTKRRPVSKPAKAPMRGLGKGLSALMGEEYAPVKPTPQAANVPSRDGAIMTLALDEIQPGKFQPREFFSPVALTELAESIRENGVMQPIIVRELAGGKYEIIAGERRWRAAGIAGQRRIPVIVRKLDDKQALENALIENIQREDLNPLEEAAGYQRLMSEFSYTQEQLSSVVFKSRSHVANLLRLLELPEEIRRLLMENQISMGHARALTGVADNVTLVREVVEKNLNVRQTEKLARAGKEPSAYKLRKQKEKEAGHALVATPSAPAAQPVPQAPAHETSQHRNAGRDPDILALEATLSENLGLKVSINDRGQAGEITIVYDSLEQLDDILRRLGGSI